MKAHTLLASVALATLTAASTTRAATTNLLERVSMQLVVQSQLPSTTNKDGTITEKTKSSSLTAADLVKALGADTNITSTPFSSGAYLAFDVVETNGTNLPAVMAVVEGSGTNLTITPVSDYLILGSYGEAIHKGTVETNGTDLTTSHHFRTLDISITNEYSLYLRAIATRNVADVTEGSGKSKIHVAANDVSWTIIGFGTEGTNSTPVIVSGSLFGQYHKVTD